MSKVTRQPAKPRALIHKRILNTANSKPNASIEELASDIGGASPALVERVLEEYGDPIEQDNDSIEKTAQSQTSSGSQDTQSSVVSELTDVSDQQRRTLRAIYEYPHLTQQELAEHLDVSAATICTRVNAIEGFEWGKRQEFVENVYEEENTMTNSSERQVEATHKIVDQFDTIAERIEELEETLEHRSASPLVLTIDQSLLHKIVHACMESDNISEEEELEIIKNLMTESKS